MRERRRVNLALVELLLAVLFFAISSVVILRLFAASHNESTQSAARTRALALSQSWADRAYALNFDNQALARLGWRENGGEYTLSEDGFRLTLCVRAETLSSGTMTRGELDIRNESSGDLLGTLPVARYAGKEATP